MVNQKQKDLYGGFLLSFEPRRTEKIAEQLYRYSNASESFSAMDWTFERRELVLLALIPGEAAICGVALMERMHGTGGTGKLRMRISAPLLIDDEIPEGVFKDIINLREKLSTAENLKRIASSDWIKLLERIKAERPSIANQLDDLIKLRDADRRLLGNSLHVMRLMEQRDALGMVFDIGSLDRRTILRTLQTEKIGNATSILDLLDNESLQEQDVIRHDEQIFKDLLTNNMRHGCFKGPNGRQVRVHVYDKKPLETVTGIDLLIYQESYKSFLLLQYKSMKQIETKRGRSWSYLVDQQLLSQTSAMRSVMNAIKRESINADGMMDWRLNKVPFYFKFCETTRPEAREDALSSGITLSLTHLEKFLSLSESNGENGGKRVGYNNCPRYLNNTQFIELAREGWIGCDAKGYTLISKLLKANQDGGKAAMLAVIEGSGAVDAFDRRKRLL